MNKMKMWEEKRVVLEERKECGIRVYEKVDRYVVELDKDGLVKINGRGYSRGILEYWRKIKEGEGFGKRKVGDKVKVVKEYIYEEREGYGGKYKICVDRVKEDGIIRRIVKRKNKGYLDYWYKVEIGKDKYVWRSYVEVIR